jgi:hypothetical protein
MESLGDVRRSKHANQNKVDAYHFVKKAAKGLRQALREPERDLVIDCKVNPKLFYS